MGFDRQSLMNNGFEGFIPISNFMAYGYDIIPCEMGVYVVLIPEHFEPEFNRINVGGHFKGKDPSISIQELKAHWISGAETIYIGKAGGLNSKATLRSRLKQYIRFGTGKPVGHWGGRLIWQLKNNTDLIIAWKVTTEEPADIESKMIDDFRKKYGDRPFANLNK